MIDAAVSTADSRQLAYIGRQPGKAKPDRDSDDWHTPSRYIEAARKVLGRIDVDPFSSATANLTVKAARFLTKADDAMHPRPWTPGPATAWLNPPYGRGVIDAAIDRFLVELPRLTAAIVLVNNSTETQWCQALQARCQAFCLPAHRISFVSPDSKRKSGNTRGQVFFYFGDDPDRFAAVFRFFGMVSTVIAKPPIQDSAIRFSACCSASSANDSGGRLFLSESVI